MVADTESADIRSGYSCILYSGLMVYYAAAVGADPLRRTAVGRLGLVSSRPPPSSLALLPLAGTMAAGIARSLLTIGTYPPHLLPHVESARAGPVCLSVSRWHFFHICAV